MILTTGPYLNVLTEDGILPGGNARANDSIKLNVQVQCSSWIDIDRVQLLINGRQSREHNYTRKSHPKFFEDGVIKFKQQLTVNLSEDAHLIVIACGEESNLKLGYGNSSQAPIQPCAYNNPIFVDVNGDGFKPNGDTLGFSLPGGKMTVAQAKKQLTNAGIAIE
jgi:hypothetical protein